KLIGALFSGWADGDSDARRDRGLLTLDLERRAQILLQPSGEAAHDFSALAVDDQKRKLIGSDPGRRVLLTQGRAEQIGDALDASIPEGVTEGVVELGKIIEVEGENRHPASLSGARVAQRSGEMVQKRAAIVQPRQLIVRQFPLQSFLHLGPFRSFPMELLPGPGQAFLPALNLPSEQLGLQQQSIGRETGDGG